MGSRRSFAFWPVVAVSAVALSVLLFGAGGYGYHRDELYFIEAGRHPAFGYDDQPPLTPLIGRASAGLFGETVTGLRVLSALAFALCVVLAALIARELGGGRRAQLFTASALAASSALFLGHLVSTSTFDYFAWTLILFLVARLLRTADRRLWAALGLAVGVALENKWLVLLLVAALAVGIVAAGRTELLRSPWLLAGMLLALALWAPNLAWQADHGWPQRELSGQIAGEDPLGVRVKFVPFQLLIVSPLLAFFWIRGLVWLLRDEAARPFRTLGLGYFALVVICLLSGAKEYYAVGWYPALVAAGGVALERWLAPLRGRLLAASAVVVSAAVSAVIALPVVPERSLAGSPIIGLNSDVAETVRWPRFVSTVARVWRSLPPGERRRAVIFTANYGEAGAIARFGPRRGLARPYSGHNSYTSFGRPPGRAGPVIAVGFDDRSYLARFFVGCRVAARYDNGLELDQEEQGAPISVCRAPRRPWRSMWEQLHHLDA